MRKFAFLTAILLLAGCDDNDRAIYGKESGLPVNCRAYVQVVVDSYRAKKYETDKLIDGLERNCGAEGYSWKNNR